MENFQSNQTINLKVDSYSEDKIDKKVWMKPVVLEISKFSILTGSAAFKGEGAWPSTVPS
ncbi:MAG: hypothetical protein ACRC2O_06370 [Chitinophagaceae bacterium]